MIESIDIIVSNLSSVPLFHFSSRIMKMEIVPMLEKNADPRAEITFIFMMTPN